MDAMDIFRFGFVFLSIDALCIYFIFRGKDSEVRIAKFLLLAPVVFFATAILWKVFNNH